MTSTREPLLVKLRRAHLRLGISALAAAGVLLTLISFLTLRAYVDQNLNLIGRSIAYTVQAAVVFRDTASAQETLSLIAEQEGLWQAELRDAHGALLAIYQHAQSSRFDALLGTLGQTVLPYTVITEVVHDGVVVGRILVRGSLAVYVQFFMEMLLAIALCLVMIGLMGARLSRRFERDIVQPLDSLASLTRAARINRTFALRALPAQVLEIDTLSEDFNALLAEIHGHELELLKRQTKLQAANEVLSHQAFHDSLTGLPNRAHFMGRLANAINASGPGGTRLAVIYIDCDHFKEINDTLGHAAGDEVLVEFARRLRLHLREGDAVARLGGDEFAVMLTPLRSIEDAQQIAAKVTEALAVPIPTKASGAIQTSATLGVAVFPDHGQSMDGLLRCADAVMYRAKRMRRGIYAIANADDVRASQVPSEAPSE